VKTAIYGIGNILLGDDGVGAAVVRYLSSNYTLPPDTTLEDLGTPSLDLPAYLAGYDRVMVPETLEGGMALSPRLAGALPRTRSGERSQACVPLIH
jgi:Ni,Fe-hydrogenase maturation factor